MGKKRENDENSPDLKREPAKGGLLCRTFLIQIQALAQNDFGDEEINAADHGIYNTFTTVLSTGISSTLENMSIAPICDRSPIR